MLLVVKINNDIPYVSASRMKIWDRCKFRFYKEYIENNSASFDESEDVDSLDDSVSVSEEIQFTFGTIVHGAIEDFWKCEKRNIKSFLECYENRWVNHGLSDRYYYELGREMIKDYFRYLIKDAPKRKHIASEASFDFKIGDARIVGRIDDIFYRGNGVYEIIDYKTSKWLPSQDEIDWDIQLALYDVAFHEDENLKKLWVDGKKPKAILLTMHFLRHYPLNTEYTKAERENTKRYVEVTHKQMQLFKKEQFVATLNNLCVFCPVKNECPAYKDAVENGSIKFISEEFDTEQIMDRILLEKELNARIKILSDELGELKYGTLEMFKNNLSNDETVEIGDREYYLIQSSRRNVNTKKAIRILDKAGLWEPEDFISYLSITKLEELTSDDYEVWQEIEKKAVYRTPTEPSIKSRKIKR